MKIGQWIVRALFENGKCAQVIKEMQRYGISILGVSEIRWNSCGKLRIATGETVLYSGMDESEKITREELASFCLNCTMSAGMGTDV